MSEHANLKAEENSVMEEVHEEIDSPKVEVKTKTRRRTARKRNEIVSSSDDFDDYYESGDSEGEGVAPVMPML